jgi:hypothetical protein
MERGTYVYDATTGNVRFTTTVDTNGALGGNADPKLPAVSGVVQANVTATLGPFDSLRITEAPNVFVDFDRVRVP